MSEPVVQTYRTRSGPMLALRTDFYMTRSLELYGEYCPEEWRMLKVDVEGFEPQVLRGARRTVERCRPVIYIENDRSEQQQEVISLVAEMGYRLFWHTPPLFDSANFNGVQENIFGRVVSVNMLCIPNESGTQVQGLQPVDPSNWTSPVQLRR